MMMVFMMVIMVIIMIIDATYRFIVDNHDYDGDQDGDLDDNNTYRFIVVDLDYDGDHGDYHDD